MGFYSDIFMDFFFSLL